MLPPGRYELQAYSEGPEAEIPDSARDADALLGDICFEVRAGQKRLQLGTIRLQQKKN